MKSRVIIVLSSAFLAVSVVLSFYLMEISALIHEISILSAKIEQIESFEYKFIPEEKTPAKTAIEQPRTMLLKNVKLTAYCPCEKCCQKTDGITASGAKAVQGVTVATDKSIPFGAKMYIDGVGERVAQDRGAAIKGNRIDVYFDAHADALEFGIQYADVIVEV